MILKTHDIIKIYKKVIYKNHIGIYIVEEKEAMMTQYQTRHCWVSLATIIVRHRTTSPSKMTVKCAFLVFFLLRARTDLPGKLLKAEYVLSTFSTYYTYTP